jgi:predicted small secreted protein
MNRRWTATIAVLAVSFWTCAANTAEIKANGDAIQPVTAP